MFLAVNHKRCLSGQQKNKTLVRNASGEICNGRICISVREIKFSCKHEQQIVYLLIHYLLAQFFLLDQNSINFLLFHSKYLIDHFVAEAV